MILKKKQRKQTQNNKLNTKNQYKFIKKDKNRTILRKQLIKMSKREKAIQYLENKRNMLQQILCNLQDYNLSEQLRNKVKKEYVKEISLLDYIILSLRRSK